MWINTYIKITQNLAVGAQWFDFSDFGRHCERSDCWWLLSRGDTAAPTGTRATSELVCGADAGWCWLMLADAGWCCKDCVGWSKEAWAFLNRNNPRFGEGITEHGVQRSTPEYTKRQPSTSCHSTPPDFQQIYIIVYICIYIYIYISFYYFSKN